MSTIIINHSSMVLLTFMWQIVQSITSHCHRKNIPVHLWLSWRADQEKRNKHLHLLRGMKGADALQGVAEEWGRVKAACSFSRAGAGLGRASSGSHGLLQELHPWVQTQESSLAECRRMLLLCGQPGKNRSHLFWQLDSNSIPVVISSKIPIRVCDWVLGT